MLTERNLPKHIAETSNTLCDIEVTPGLATAMLTYNTHNRTLRNMRVQHFALILQENRWINTGEPAIMSRTTLNEGQHRLHAIVKAGIAAPMDIRFGVSARAFEVTGTGATRSAGDVLSITGLPSHNALAAMLRVLLAYERGIVSGASFRGVGGDEVLAAYNRWPGCIEAQHMMQNRFMKTPFYSAVAAAFIYLALQCKNPGTVEDFLRAVETGVVKDTQDPARLLRERLFRDQTLRRGTGDAMLVKLALFILAWNGWLAGERPKALTWQKGNGFPKLS